MNFITDPISKLALARGLWEESHAHRHRDCTGSVFDSDSRRWLKVTCRKAADFMDENDQSFDEIAGLYELAPSMFAAIRAELDTGPPNLTALVVTIDGEVLSRSTDPIDDVTPGTHYASVDDYQIPAHTKRLGRDELVEVSRLIAFVDIVAPVSPPSLEGERLVFKYYQSVLGLDMNWNAIHIAANLSHHPHIAPVRHVIVDETDRSRVVGFTVPFFPGGDIGARRSFKLKWVKQLLQTLDDLHLKYGVFHGDIHAGNMVVNPATDNLVLIDFGFSGKIGTPYLDAHNRAALEPETQLYPLWSVAYDVTRAFEMVFRKVTGTGVYIPDSEGGLVAVSIDDMKKGGWAKGSDVELDASIEDYYEMCIDWLSKRNNGTKITKNCEASEPLNYPDYMPPPQVDIDADKRKKARRAELLRRQAELGIAPRASSRVPLPMQQPPPSDNNPVLLEDMRLPPTARLDISSRWWADVVKDCYATSGRHFMRLDAVEAGQPFLNWERPSTARLDPTRRILANGKYEDEYRSAGAKRNGRKRKDRADEERRGNVADDNIGNGGGGTTTSASPTRRVTRSATRQAEAAAAQKTPESTPETAGRKSTPRKTAGRKSTGPKSTLGKAAGPRPAHKTTSPRAGEPASTTISVTTNGTRDSDTPNKK